MTDSALPLDRHDPTNGGNPAAVHLFSGASPPASNSELALRYAKRGLAVFPCGADKKPRVKWKDESTRDQAKIGRWWSQYPNALVALDCGKAGIVVIDCDRHDNAPDGVAAIEDILGVDPVMLGCPMSQTAGDGVHLFFAQPDGEPFGNAEGALKGRGINVRGAGGYIIAPGSTRPDGSRWATMPGTPDLDEAYLTRAIPELPEKLADLIRSKPEREAAPEWRAEDEASDPPPKSASAGDRERAYAAKALESCAAGLAAAGKGGRNNLLNTAAFSMGRMVARNWIERSRVVAELEAACRANGLLREDGPHAVRATILSGLRGGLTKPHEDLVDRERPGDAEAEWIGDEIAEELKRRDAPSAHGAGESGSQSKASANWPEPKPLLGELPPVPAFDQAFLPDALRPWVSDIAERMQCALDFVAVSVLVALGSIIGRKVAIRPQRFTDWFEVANLWACIVGRPGVMKSPAMNEALKPLNKLEAKANKENEEALAEFRRATRVHELKVKASERAASKLKADDITDDVLAGDAPEPPRMRRYIVGDTTYEKLGETLAHNPDGVLAFRDELVSLLKSLDDERNAAARGFYLQAWMGTSGYTFDRVVRGLVRIEAACLSLLGSTQPGRLGEYVRRSQGAGDDGMLQRFSLLVWPDQTLEWRLVDRYPDSSARGKAWETFDRLAQMTPHSVGAEMDEFGGIPFLRFDDAAQRQFDEWRDGLEKRLRAGELSPALESHLAKFRKLVPALALISHLADGGRGPVTETALLRALAIAEYAEAHARRCYSAADQGEVIAAKAILAHIRKGDLTDGFALRDVHQSKWSKLTDREQVQKGLDLLVELDWLRGRKVQTGGCPSVKYAINPRARE